MGPYYEREGIQIWHGDCVEVLEREGFTADLVLTDPPYGVGIAEWDDSIPDLRWLEICRQAAPVVFVTPGNGNLYCYPRPFWVAAWTRFGSVQRARGGGFSHWEPILIYGKSRLEVDCRAFHPHTGVHGVEHPCPKPPALWRWLIEESTDEGDVVLDPFLGSGTTCVVAIQTSRRAIGIEIEEKYCEVAAARCEASFSGVEYRGLERVSKGLFD